MPLEPGIRGGPLGEQTLPALPRHYATAKGFTCTAPNAT